MHQISREWPALPSSPPSDPVGKPRASRRMSMSATFVPLPPIATNTLCMSGLLEEVLAPQPGVSDDHAGGVEKPGDQDPLQQSRHAGNGVEVDREVPDAGGDRRERQERGDD